MASASFLRLERMIVWRYYLEKPSDQGVICPWFLGACRVAARSFYRDLKALALAEIGSEVKTATNEQKIKTLVARLPTVQPEWFVRLESSLLV